MRPGAPMRSGWKDFIKYGQVEGNRMVLSFWRLWGYRWYNSFLCLLSKEQLFWGLSITGNWEGEVGQQVVNECHVCSVPAKMERERGRAWGLCPSSDFPASKGCQALMLSPGAPLFPVLQVFTDSKPLPTQYFWVFMEALLQSWLSTSLAIGNWTQSSASPLLGVCIGIGGLRRSC